MTKQEFIDKYVGKIFDAGIMPHKFDTGEFTEEFNELLAEQEDIEHERGYQHGWNDCSKGL